MYFRFVVQVVPDPSLLTLSNNTLQSVAAYIQFTNLDSCTDSTTMPNEVKYTLRMQEYVTDSSCFTLFLLTYLSIEMAHITIMLML